MMMGCRQEKNHGLLFLDNRFIDVYKNCSQ
jgi:hypothetical protein